MQKTKLPIVSILSFLIILTPVLTAIANTEKAEKPVKELDEGSKNLEERKTKAVFKKIEKEGGEGVTDKELAKKEGEGPFGAMVGAITGAVVGLGASLANGIVNHHGAARMARDVVVATMTCGAAGATIGGMVSGPA